LRSNKNVVVINKTIKEYASAKTGKSNSGAVFLNWFERIFPKKSPRENSATRERRERSSRRMTERRRSRTADNFHPAGDLPQG